MFSPLVCFFLFLFLFFFFNIHLMFLQEIWTHTPVLSFSSHCTAYPLDRCISTQPCPAVERKLHFHLTKSVERKSSEFKSLGSIADNKIEQNRMLWPLEMTKGSIQKVLKVTRCNMHSRRACECWTIQAKTTTKRKMRMPIQRTHWIIVSSFIAFFFFSFSFFFFFPFILYWNFLLFKDHVIT